MLKNLVTHHRKNLRDELGKKKCGAQEYCAVDVRSLSWEASCPPQREQSHPLPKPQSMGRLEILERRSSEVLNERANRRGREIALCVRHFFPAPKSSQTRDAPGRKNARVHWGLRGKLCETRLGELHGLAQVTESPGISSSLGSSLRERDGTTKSSPLALGYPSCL